MPGVINPAPPVLNPAAATAAAAAQAASILPGTQYSPEQWAQMQQQNWQQWAQWQQQYQQWHQQYGAEVNFETSNLICNFYYTIIY